MSDAAHTAPDTRFPFESVDPYICSRAGYFPSGGAERSSSQATRVFPWLSRKSGWVTSSPVSATPTSTPVPSIPLSLARLAVT